MANESQSRFDLRGKRVWVAGHRGMVGSALLRRLEAEQCDVLTVPRAMGWTPRVALGEGLAQTYDWFLRHHAGAA